MPCSLNAKIERFINTVCLKPIVAKLHIQQAFTRELGLWQNNRGWYFRNMPSLQHKFNVKDKINLNKNRTDHDGCKGPGSSVGITTGNGLDGPGTEFPWARDFAYLSRLTLGPTQPPVQWVSCLFRGKERPGREADPLPILVPWSRKSKAIPLLPLRAVRPVQSLSACTRVHFTLLLRWGQNQPKAPP